MQEGSLIRFITFIALLLQEADLGTCHFYPSIHWTSRNPIFSSGNTRLCVLPSSKVIFVCPNPATILTRMEQKISKSNLYENLWFVSKSSYESCEVRGGMDRAITKCDSPLELRYETIVFQRYTAAEDGLQFLPGKEYYFIATSDGSKESLNNTSGGHCSKYHMRLRFYVCKEENDPLCADTCGWPRTYNDISDPTVASATYTESSQEKSRKKATPLMCHTCEDCGHAQGKEASCSPGLNRCMSKSYTSTEGKKTITKNCANTTSCHTEQEACKTNKCKVRCCTSNLCSTATSSASYIKHVVPFWWILGSLYALGWWL